MTNNRRVKVVRPNQHKIGHSGDVPQDNLLAWHGKTKPSTTKARIQNKSTTTQNKHKKTKARFSRPLRHPVWKCSGYIYNGKDK